MSDYNSVRRNDYTEDKWIILTYMYQKSKLILRIDVTNLLKNASWQISFSKVQKENPKYTGWLGRTIDFLYLSPNWNLPIAGTYIYHNASSDHIPVILDLLR